MGTSLVLIVIGRLSVWPTSTAHTTQHLRPRSSLRKLCYAKFHAKNSPHMNTAKYVKVVGVVLLGVCLASCSTTRLDDDVTYGTRRENGDIARRLLKIEDEWAQLDLIIGKDPNAVRAVFDRILAPDFVNTNRKGTVMDKNDFIAGFEDDRVESAVNSDMVVHVYAKNAAVVTGIDNTRGRDQAGNAFSHQDRFTDTYVKRGGVWQCVSAQNARIK